MKENGLLTIDACFMHKYENGSLLPAFFNFFEAITAQIHEKICLIKILHVKPEVLIFFQVIVELMLQNS